MSVPFKKPKFAYDYNLQKEKDNFDKFFTGSERAIPVKKPDEIDLASWNIANIGVQERRGKDLKLIAYMLSQFDIIAVQEVNSNLGHFSEVMRELASDNYDMVMTDSAGNDERLAVVYKKDRIRPRQLFGELDYNPAGKIIGGNYVIPSKKQSFVCNGKKIEMKFSNFNRNPFLSTWEVVGSKVTFMLANVHIYYGKKTKSSAQFKNRISEVYYLANWAREQQKAKKAANLYEKNVILIGDMNIPRMKSKDAVYKALMRRGMRPSSYSSQTGTTIQEFNTFDQIVFTNNVLKVIKINGRAATVVDFDNFIFPDLWKQKEDGVRTIAQFKAWTKFAISDHRPIFIRLKV
jgi:exonuclease III